MTTPTHKLEVTDCPIADLRTYYRNPRRGDTALIARSLRVNGQYKPLCVNRGTHTGRPLEVLAGNHTLMAARDEGWASVAVCWVDVDDDQAARIVAADNRTSDLGEYDDRLLAELLASLPDLDGTGYDPGDLADLEAALAAAELPPAFTDPDAIPDLPADPICVVGDVWELGPHRLLCGNSTNVQHIDTLLGGNRPDMVFTDPPYGMNVDVEYGQTHQAGLHPSKAGRYRPVIGDDQSFDAAPLIALFDDVAEQFWWGADYYRTAIPAGGSWVVWDKRDNDLGMNLDALIGAAFELCWSRQQHKREIARVLWSGHHGMQHEDTKARVHPTQKPVGLVEWFLDRWGTPGDVVLDLFGGSGSTLIGCHAAGRVARLMELDPRYCDVICRRYQEHTGMKPVRAGAPHDFTEAAGES